MTSKKVKEPKIEYIVEVVSPRGAVEEKSFKTQEEANKFGSEREYEDWTVSQWVEINGKVADCFSDGVEDWTKLVYSI